MGVEGDGGCVRLGGLGEGGLGGLVGGGLAGVVWKDGGVMLGRAFWWGWDRGCGIVLVWGIGLLLCEGNCQLSRIEFRSISQIRIRIRIKIMLIPPRHM